MYIKTYQKILFKFPFVQVSEFSVENKVGQRNYEIVVLGKRVVVRIARDNQWTKNGIKYPFYRKGENKHKFCFGKYLIIFG